MARTSAAAAVSLRKSAVGALVAIQGCSDLQRLRAPQNVRKFGVEVGASPQTDAQTLFGLDAIVFPQQAVRSQQAAPGNSARARVS